MCGVQLKLNTRFLFLVAIIAIAASALATEYIIQGPGWDLIAHFENGKSLLNPALYSCLGSPPCGLDNGQLTFWYGTYFEPYRAPMSGLIFALVYFVFGNATMIVYIGLLLALYVIIIWFVAERFKIDKIAALLPAPEPRNPPHLHNRGSEEMVSLIFLFVGLYFLAKRNPVFGLFLGLATLGKYPTLALIPMLLLLVRPKKILYGVILFVIAVSPWLIFSQIFFHNALASYKMSLAIETGNRQLLLVQSGRVCVDVRVPVDLFGSGSRGYVQKEKLGGGFYKENFDKCAPDKKAL